MSDYYRKIFVERQRFEYFVYALMAGLEIIYLFPPFRWPWNLAPISFIGIVASFLFIETTVTERSVRVRFGYLFPLYVRTIPIDEIETVEATTYAPLQEYGGWGIRGIGANVALNARGNRGVRLGLTGSRRLLIGSQRPEELEEAIRSAKQA